MTNELRPDLHGDVAPISSSVRLCRILALSGGGYRGLFSAHVLHQLEKRAGRKISEIFDLIIGTSTGSLIGAAAAVGIPAADIEDAYLKKGRSIFRRRRFHTLRRFVHSAPYSSVPLQAAIQEILGVDIAQSPLKELNVPFAAVALSHTREQIRIFGAGKFAQPGEDIALEDAIIASAAAPTYFPSKRYKGENLLDGGLVANAPELIGLSLAKNIIGASTDDIRMLAIGTASASGGLPALVADSRGVLAWLLSRRGLVRLIMTAQEHHARQLTQQLLGNNYVAVDQPPTPDQVRAVSELDQTSKLTADTLCLLADVAWSNFLSDPRHFTFLQSKFPIAPIPTSPDPNSPTSGDASPSR